MNSRFSSALLASLLGTELLLAGCAGGPTPDLLALPSGMSASRPMASTRSPGPGPTLNVRRVSVPEYLASRRVRYWRSAGSLAEWPDTFWAERIEVGVSREFTAALQGELPGWTVCESACGDVAADVTIKLDLVRLDYMRNEGRLKAVARTWVTGPSTAEPDVHATGRADDDLDLPVTPDTAEGQAAAVSSLLHGLAKTGAALAIERQAFRGRTITDAPP